MVLKHFSPSNVSASVDTQPLHIRKAIYASWGFVKQLASRPLGSSSIVFWYMYYKAAVSLNAS